MKWNSGAKKYEIAVNPPGASQYGGLMKEMDGSLNDQDYLSQQQAFLHQNENFDDG